MVADGALAMTTWRLLTTTWDLEPSILAGCAALLAAYALLARPLVMGRAALYAGGVLVLLLALISPIDTLGAGYLFSAHMLQHLLLVLVVPPLLLLGIPAAAYARALAWGPARRAERALGRPLVAWPLGIATLWVWHYPAVYDAVLTDVGLHILQHLSFLVTSTIFWWPVLAPVEAARGLGPLGAIVYLLAAVIASSVLGIVITFAPPGLYPAYLRPIDRSGALTLLRDGWGLTPAVDQQIGGVLMWVVGAPLYLLGVLVVLARWFGAPDTDDETIGPLTHLARQTTATKVAGRQT